MKFASMLLGAAAARRSFDLLNLAEDAAAQKTREDGEQAKALLAFTAGLTDAQVPCGTAELCTPLCDGLKMTTGTATMTYKTATGTDPLADCSVEEGKNCMDTTADFLFCATDATCTAGKVGDVPASCGGGSGLVIGLVVAGVVLVGGGLGFYCYKKNSAASEGGHKESLFVKM